MQHFYCMNMHVIFCFSIYSERNKADCRFNNIMNEGLHRKAHKQKNKQIIRAFDV